MKILFWIIGIVVLALFIIIVVWLYNQYQKDKRRDDLITWKWGFEDTLDRLFADKVPKRFLS